MVVALTATAVLLGCRHGADRTAQPPAQRPAPPSKDAREASLTPPTGTPNEADGSGAGHGASTPAADVVTGAAQGTHPPGAKEAKDLLRRFVELLAAGHMDEARALFVDETTCRQLFAPKYDCRAIAEAQRDGFQKFVDDPVPLGSKVTGVWLPGDKEFGSERGFSRPTHLWPGAIITVKAPQGYAFQIRSLSVFDTPAGLRIMWGKRRSGPDPPRSPERRKALLERRAAGAAKARRGSAKPTAVRPAGGKPGAASTRRPSSQSPSQPKKTKH